MKKLIIAMMIIALVVVMAVSVSAAEAPATDFEYEVVGDAVTIKAYKGAGGEVEIPATIEGKPVTVIADKAFYQASGYTGITKITLPNTVVTIGNQAFYNQRGIVTEFVIPDSVTTIGDEAFFNCRFLEKIVIGKGVTSIGKAAMGDLRAVKEIVLSAENTAFKMDGGCLIDIANKAVIAGQDQKTLTIPVGVETIADYAFNYHKAVETVIIPNTVKTIGIFSFQGTTMSTVAIPKSVTTIGNGAFVNAKFNGGHVYYEGTQAEYDAINWVKNADNATQNKDVTNETTRSTKHYNACMNNPTDWTHSGADAASCTYCAAANPPAGGQTPSAPQTGSSVTVLAVVAVVALAATAVVISKRRIED